MRRFPGQDLALIGFSPSLEKIRAITRNWEAKVPKSPAGARKTKGGEVLGLPEIDEDLRSRYLLRILLILLSVPLQQHGRYIFYRLFGTTGDMELAERA